MGLLFLTFIDVIKIELSIGTKMSTVQWLL